MPVAGPLAGVRVLECGSGVSAAFGARLIADFGADVVKVEAPGGDATRSWGPVAQASSSSDRGGLFAYLNANKRGVTLDLSRREARSIFESLLERADVLIHNVPPASREDFIADRDSLASRYPRLITAGISPFGDTGPHKDWRSYELNVSNAGGWAFLSPGASPYPELPPLKCFGHQCELQAGLHAAFLTLAAIRHRGKSGVGQAIEISEQEVIAAMLEMNFMHYSYAGRETSRLGQRLLGPWFIGDCADGQMFIICVQEDQWDRLVEFMGTPEWTREEIFRDRIERGRNQDALKALMTEWLAGWKVRDLFVAAQQRRIPLAPVNSMAMIYDDPHLKEREAFVPFVDPELGEFRMPRHPAIYGKLAPEVRRPAPRLGEHNRDIYCSELGLSEAKTAELRGAGVI